MTISASQHGETSDEDGEDIYRYVGEPVLRRINIQDLEDSIVSGHPVDLGEDASDSRNLLDVSEHNQPDMTSDSLTNEHERSDDVQSSVHESISHDMHGNHLKVIHLSPQILILWGPAHLLI